MSTLPENRTPKRSFDSGHREAIDAAIGVVRARIKVYQDFRDHRGPNFPIGMIETELSRVLSRLAGLRRGGDQ